MKKRQDERSGSTSFSLIDESKLGTLRVQTGHITNPFWARFQSKLGTFFLTKNASFPSKVKGHRRRKKNV